MNNEGYETKKIEKQLRLTFEVLRVTNINFLLTTSEIIKNKGYENYLIDYQGSENTLILTKFSQLFLKDMYGSQSGEFVCGSWGLTD